MKNLRRILSVLALFAFSASVVSAGGRQDSGSGSSTGTGSSSTTPAAQPAKVIELMFAGTEASTTGQSRAMQAMADKLNADGRFKATVQVNGALSSDTDALVTQAKMGVPLVVPSDPGRLASQFNISDLNILMAPYVLTDRTLLTKLPDTAIFQEWQKQLEAQGITFVADMYNGFRSFYTTTPVQNVQDLSGLRIRGFGNKIGNALAKYLGYANIGITWGEVVPGIQQKTLDGCEVQVATAVGSNIYEVTKYLALTKHYLLQSSFVCSTNLLKNMPADARDFFLKVVRDVSAEYSEIVAQEEEPFYQTMRDNGVTITEVDLQEWQNALAPLYTNNDLGFTAGLKDRLFQELGL